MTLCDVNKLFGTEARCRELLKRLRWPAGVECPRCHDKRVSWISTQEKFECGECQYQFSVTSNTVFHDTHLPLVKWFLATLLLCESRKGHSANQVKRELGISYKTAWYLCHRIRAAMVDSQKMMDGTIEMDETYVGGKATGKGWRGRNVSNKEVVVGIRQRNGDLRFFHASDAKSGTLAAYIRDNVSQDFEILVTDEWSAYPPALKKAGVAQDKHRAVNHSSGIYAIGDIHTNSIESAFSLLKRGIVGTWHKISAKHLPAYLDEMCFRFNRRQRSDLFVDTLRHMITAPVLTFEQLTADKRPLREPPPTPSSRRQTFVIEKQVF